MDFCRKRRLSLATLARYRKRQGQEAEVAAGSWLAVEVRGATPVGAGGGSSGVAVALAGGRRIEVGRGFDAPTLVELLGVLDRN